MLYYLPLVLTVVANVFYHISQKYTSNSINPIFSLFVTYLVATALSAVILVFYKHENTTADNMRELNWSAFTLGLAIVLLELGFLLVYRVGWDIRVASITSTITLAIILLPIGRFMFGETVSLVNVIGVGVSVVGIVLMNYSRG
ncbi:MAG: EamA family transporter [Clostridiales Family XIII bacterium]|jgi:uncharacterized membrane protein|nr:EamA family transporter [Clostridiales Family XIII bacterium]